MGSADRRSPIKQKPLRQPGQSVDDRFQAIIDDRVLSYILACGFVIVLALWEWYRSVTGTPPEPWLFTILAIGVVAFSAWRLAKTLPELRQLRLGSEGEKAVGQMLEALRADGFEVFHDIPGDGFNIDHVIVGPQGAFTIETKTISKPPRGSVEVVFDGEKITVDGWTPDRNPVEQSLAQSKWLHDMLQRATGHSFWVQPVIVYPGWYVREAAQGSRVWVLNPDRLRGKIQKIPERLKPDEVALIADRMALRVRNQDKR